MKIIPINELKEGDLFIWADQSTRDFMYAVTNKVLGVLKFHVSEPADDGGHGIIGRMYLTKVIDGSGEVLLYRAKDRVILIENDHVTDYMDHRIRCTTCGNTLGGHYGWATETGLFCDSGGKKLVDRQFIPNGPDIRKYHPECFSVDFFADLGL